MNRLLHSIIENKKAIPQLLIVEWPLTYFKSSIEKAPGSNCSTVTSFSSPFTFVSNTGIFDHKIQQ